MNVDKLFDLSGRTAIITGATRGIGFALAQGHLAAGANVVVTGRSEDRCRAAQEALEADAPGRTAAIAAHMGDLNQVKELVTQTVSTFGGIDIVVNNAATSLLQRFGDIARGVAEVVVGQRDRPAVLGAGGATASSDKRTRGGGQPDLAGGLYVRRTLQLYAAGEISHDGLDALDGCGVRPQRDPRQRARAGPVDTQMMRNNPPRVHRGNRQ